MIDINLLFQVVLFGSYEDISPNPETIKYFIEKFSDKGLIPTTFQELGPNGAVNRFSLASSDGVWSIEFSSNRIDISKSNKDIGVTDMGEISQFIVEIREIVGVINEKFPKKHNRLSLISRYLFPEMDDRTMSSIYAKLNNTIEFYKKNLIADWNNRAVSRIAYDIGGVPELFNIISEVKRTMGNLSISSKNQKIDRVELLFDLNTYQGNSDYRFDLSSVNLFLNTITGIESDLKENYIKLIES